MSLFFVTLTKQIRPITLLGAPLIIAALSCGHESTAPPVAVATELVFTTPPPDSTVVGTIITPAIVVTAHDVNGKIATSFTGAVTLAFGLNPHSATLGGTVTVAAVAGVATFTDISLNKVGVGYTLVASSGDLTSATTTVFSVAPGAAALLGKTGGDLQSGPITVALTTPLSVTVTDALGNPVSGVTVNWTTTNGGTLSPTGGPTNAAGVASATWTLGTALGTQTASAAVSGLNGSPISFGATATIGPATQLVFTRQPTNATAGAAILPAIVVTARDAGGNTATAYIGAVTLTLGANPGASTVSGTATATAVGGVATFSNVSVNKAATGYTLVANATGLTPGTSTTFAIAVGVAADLVIASGNAQGSLAGAFLAAPLSAMVTDAAGNGVSGATVNWAAVTGGGSVGTPTSVTNAFGVATNTWTLGTTVGFQTATAAATGLAGSPVTFTATATSFAFASLAASVYDECGLTAGGAAYCLGGNYNGQLGDGTTTQRSAATPVVGGVAFASLAPGWYHSCGLTAGGVAYCWGDNFYGELGDGTTTQRLTPTPVAGGLLFSSLSAGANFTCGLTPAGVAYCWGDNSKGGLGNSAVTQSLTPAQVAGGLTFTSITSGQDHSCALTTAGAAYCWGANGSGQLGNTIQYQSDTPVAVQGGLAFTSISGGGLHTCALTSGGAAYCWGTNSFGELGDGTTTARNTPGPVTGGIAFASLTVGGGQHTCGLNAAGTAYCWGTNIDGELGNGTISINPNPTPAPVSGGFVFASLAGGVYHTCGLTAGGGAYCWGDNGTGEIGDGTTINRPLPTFVMP
jgi:alpha-tubulin suppressor-like RCC1 family protein